MLKNIWRYFSHIHFWELVLNQKHHKKNIFKARVRLIKAFHYSRPIYSARKIGSAIHLSLITQKKKHKTANASLFPIHITRVVACHIARHCMQNVACKPSLFLKIKANPITLKAKPRGADSVFHSTADCSFLYLETV